MAGTKKKKKPAANPARGFATTSIASKPRPENAVEETPKPLSKADAAAAHSGTTETDPGPVSGSPAQKQAEDKPLSPEEFEKQLEESQLQILVEKHAAKVKRDAQRQKTRLETDRRLLRGQADPVNAPKWLPQDLMDYILDLIHAESRFAASSLSSEAGQTGKMPAEEDMIARLWTLQQTLEASAFPQPRIQAVMQFVLDISPNISASGKDMIWGLEEALEWLARECSPEELPPYEAKSKPLIRGQYHSAES